MGCRNKKDSVEGDKPSVTTLIIADSFDDVEVDVGSLTLGMKFFADMINRLWFFITCIAILITFCCTFVQCWIGYAI